MHSESKQYQNIRSLEQRKPYFRATQGEKKNKQTWAPWKLSEKHFSRKAERVAWLLLGSEPLFLRSGHDVPVNLPPKQLLLSVLTRKGQVSRHHPLPVRSRPRPRGEVPGWSVFLPEGIHPAPSLGPLPVPSPGWGGRSWWAAAWVGSPDPTQPLSLREPGAWDPAWPLRLFI